jgi:hypothetical protein
MKATMIKRLKMRMPSKGTAAEARAEEWKRAWPNFKNIGGGEKPIIKSRRKAHERAPSKPET